MFSFHQTLRVFTTVIAVMLAFQVHGSPIPISTTLTDEAVPGSGEITFEVDIPSDHNGWRLHVRSNNLTSVELARLVDGSAENHETSNNTTRHTLILPPDELEVGETWRITMTGSAGTTFDLMSDPVYARQLTWDAGASSGGSDPLSQPDAFGGDYYFRITTEEPSRGVWRSILLVDDGEADLAMRRQTPPWTSATHASNRPGSDGIVLHDSQFGQNEVWYLRVRADRDSEWSIFSGDIFVHDLGTLAAHDSDASSSGPVTIGPEGLVYFRTTITEGTEAWRLWLPGENWPIHVEQGSAPVPDANRFSRTGEGQFLAVPPFVTGGVYFVSVSGSVGTTVELDSRRQEIRTPSTQPGYTGANDFDFTLEPPSSVTGFRFVTYRVDVPFDQVAWQVNLTPLEGSSNVYIRRGEVPNRGYNDGLSEAPSSVIDSITMVPPALSEGSWYVTIHGGTSYRFRLTSGNPVITTIPFVGSISNDHLDQSGWRYYQVTDIESQIGVLGWELELAGQQPGTEIALRRNAVPSRWNYRSNGNLNQTSSSSHLDYSSVSGILQRQDHEADIWFVGIYTPNAALGNFDLETSLIEPETMGFEGGTVTVEGLPIGVWHFHRVVVPDGVAGWVARLEEVGDGNPRMVISRSSLPVSTSTSAGLVNRSTWSSGEQWSPSSDYTGLSPNVTGRMFTAGMGSPLVPGTYYIGVLANSGDGPIDYTLTSETVGFGPPSMYQVRDLDFNGGVIMGDGLEPRDPSFYRVVVPEGASSWELALEPTVGEAMMVIRHGALGNIAAPSYMSQDRASDSSTHLTGRKHQRPGNEYFYKYPDHGSTSITPGTYYVTVVSEGQGQSGNTIGAGPVSYTLTSAGEVPIDDRTDTLIGSGSPIHWDDQSLDRGSERVYRFRAPEGISALEARFTNVTGSPWIFLRRDAEGEGRIPAASQAPNDGRRSSEGGWNIGWRGSSLVSIPNSEPGDYTLVVKSVDGPSNFNLQVSAGEETSIDFIDGEISIEEQPGNSWQHFRVDVPPDALGWIVRLSSVTSGNPRIAIRRGSKPDSFSNSSNMVRLDHWPEDHNWGAGSDYTGLGPNNERQNRLVVVGMGSPLEPGTYYIGVQAAFGSDPLSYTLESKGIGIGEQWPYQVRDLDFDGGEASGEGLEPRDFSFYRVIVPEGTDGWEVSLEPTEGEAMMVLRHEALGNVEAESFSRTQGDTSIVTDSTSHWQGRKHQQEGMEYFYKRPSAGEETITPGAYFITVVSEGRDPSGNNIGTGTANYTISSKAGLSILDHTSSPLQVGNPIFWQGQSLHTFQEQVYRFRVTEELLGVELRLSDVSGEPWMFVRHDPVGQGSVPRSVQFNSDGPRASEGGSGIGWRTDSTISIGAPEPGDYTVVVKSNGVPSTFGLEVRAETVEQVGFNDGEFLVEAQPADSWRYFQIEVPEGPLGWMVHLTDVTSGNPRIAIRRGDIPDSFSTSTNLTRNPAWQEGQTWASDWDYTGLQPQTTGRYRKMVMGMNSPLEPGTYFVGVRAQTGSDPMSYTLESRGIGLGEMWSIPVHDLPFDGGAASGEGLEPRMPAFYRVVVPEGANSWEVNLVPTVGEVMMVIRHDALGNITASPSTTTTSSSSRYGRKFQHSGREFFYKYPLDEQTDITPGNYYITVVSEGQDQSGNSIGSGPVSYTVTSIGEIIVADQTATPLAMGSPVSWDGESLHRAQEKVYRFRVTDPLDAIEVQFANRTGSPWMFIRRDSPCSGRIPRSSAFTSDGPTVSEGGWDWEWREDSIATISNVEPGDYTVVVKSPDGASTFDLLVNALETEPLNYDPVLNTQGGTNVVSGELLDNQVDYYRVEVPELLDGEPLTAWRLRLSLQTGSLTMRITKDSMPVGASNETRSSSPETIIAKPQLTPGTWYIEVRGSGLTQYTLTSSSVTTRRVWQMPVAGELADVPGLSHPQFGDSGIDDQGIAIINPETGEPGTDIAGGTHHFYLVEIPEGNGGLLSTRLINLNGSPRLYIREGTPPTLDHNTNGGPQNPGIFDREDTSSGTQYGNWVPLDGRSQVELPEGDHWVMVHGSGSSSSRYRLHLSVGNVTDLDLDGGSVTDQYLTAKDMRYYRFQVPESSMNPGEGAPTEWTFTFSESLGDVGVFVRETIPPGQGDAWNSSPHDSQFNNGFRDWRSDNSVLDSPSLHRTYTDTGSHTIGLPPLKPGHVYYLGVFAYSDASFDLSSSIGSETLQIDGVVDFVGGEATGMLAAGDGRIFRIDVPADGVHWNYSASRNGVMNYYLHQGTVPPESNRAHWDFASGSTRSESEGLFVTSYPWQPERTYYLVVRNSGDSEAEYQFQSDGILRDDCEFSISLTSVTIAHGGASNRTVSISTPGGCHWEASTAVDWITIVNNTSGFGDYTLRYDVAANPIHEQRTGTIMIADQELTVIQGPAPTPTATPTPTPAPFCMGDANGDGIVNLNDFIAVRDNFGQSNPAEGDANGDGIVNLNDFIAVRDNFGRSCP